METNTHNTVVPFTVLTRQAHGFRLVTILSPSDFLFQLEDLDEPDHCNDNLVSGNTISTNGNECVDIKEGSSGNIVTNNVCSWQMDQMSAGFNIRGNNNTIE